MSEGNAIWFEWLGGDVDAAQAFYGEVIGWSIAPSGMAGVDYRIATAPDGDTIGGMMRQPEGMAITARWMVYYGVEDVDGSAARIASLGGGIHIPPMDIPGVGRFALGSDPQGVPFYVMRGNADQPSRAFVQGSEAIGHGVWTELATPDPDAAFGFYGDLFGWTREGAMPMGDMGEYAFIGAGEARPGAVMSSTTTGAPAAWGMYFLVPDIDAGVAAVTAGGGSLVQGPTTIPSGDYSAKFVDPDGIAFGLVGSRKGATGAAA